MTAALLRVHPIVGTLLTGICADCNVWLVSGQADGQLAAFAPNRLKQAAEEHGMPLPALARKLGVSEKTVYRWNAGRNLPRYDSVTQIADLLDRDPSWFFSEPEEKAA